MSQVVLACPSCDFVVASFTEEQLETDSRKQKRLQYLKSKDTLCPNCMTKTRNLVESRGAEAEAALARAPVAKAPPAAAKVEAPAQREAAGHGALPLCEALEEGPWPSHVTELKKSRYHLQMYEEGLRLRQTQWGFGGYISLPGVAAGILVRASARPDIAGGANFVRVLPPSGGWYSTETLRALCDVADEHAYGVLHLHSAGGDVEILGITTEGLGSAVEALNAQGLDVGSTSDAFRNTVECLGATRCDAVLADAADLREAWYRRFLDDVQYPRFPHKVKVKFSGCPNDCARAQQKSDIGVIGIFRDAPKVDQARLQEWIGQGGDIHRIVMNCPTKAMEYDDGTLTIDDESCVHCMYCINKCSYTIRPGDDRGVAITVGGKLRGKYGPLMGKVLIPFLPLHPPDYPEIMDAIEKIAAVFDENAKRKERLGDFLFRVGLDQFTKWMGIDPSPRQLAEPRSNVFYHWEAEEVSPDGGASESRVVQ